MDINSILEKHTAWLNGDSESGERANLWDCNGNMTHIKSVFCGQYPVTYTSEILQIGCQQHNIAEWWEFDNNRILEMNGKTALKWWRTWKPILQQIIETAPAEATGDDA